MPGAPRPTDSRDRHVQLEGAVNFRDLGGYETADGRRTRWGTVYRSDGLSSLTEQDRAVIRQLGITTVVDLRSSAEVAAGRFPVEDVPVGYHHLPLVDELPDAKRFEVVPGFLASHYQEIAGPAAGQIGKVLTILADPAAQPAVVHCAAGKDRTGVLVAVLLGLLGVPDAVIVDDYALSGAAMADLRRRIVDRDPAAKELVDGAVELFSASPANMAALLAAVQAEHGSMEEYAARCGVGPSAIAGLRSTLLE